MRRIYFLLMAVFAVAAFTTACNDDDGGDNNPGTTDKCAEVQCEEGQTCNADTGKCEEGNAEEPGPYDECAASYEAPADPTDLCTNADDLGVLGGEDAPDLGGIASAVTQDDCGGLQFIINPPTEEQMDELVACVTCGVADQAKISKDCASCTAAVVACVVAHCALKCKDDDSAPDCMACREENGCDEGQDACTGDLSGGGGEDLCADANCDEGQTCNPDTGECVDDQTEEPVCDPVCGDGFHCEANDGGDTTCVAD